MIPKFSETKKHWIGDQYHELQFTYYYRVTLQDIAYQCGGGLKGFDLNTNYEIIGIAKYMPEQIPYISSIESTDNYIVAYENELNKIYVRKDILIK